MSCSPNTCTCGDQLTLDSLEDLTVDPIVEAIAVESTKWAKLLATIGFPYDTAGAPSPESIELLDDDMIRELAVAWYDMGIADDGETSTEIESFEDSIRMELGLYC